MKKIAILALGLTIIAAPAFAQSSTDSKTQDTISDAVAVQKDNTALAHDNANLAANRAAKAKAKANGDIVGQATSSVKLGANHVAKTEKESEKGIDQGNLNDDTK